MLLWAKLSNFATFFDILCSRLMRFLNKYSVVVGFIMLLASCHQRQERVVTPYGSVLDSVEVTEDFETIGANNWVRNILSVSILPTRWV